MFLEYLLMDDSKKNLIPFLYEIKKNKKAIKKN